MAKKGKNSAIQQAAGRAIGLGAAAAGKNPGLGGVAQSGKAAVGTNPGLGGVAQSGKAAIGPAPAAAPSTATGTAAPPTPVAVDPFFTADDLDAINQFTTDLGMKLEGIDFDLKNAETDTTFSKTQNETAAKQSSGAAVDDAIGRGIFQSSIKDATLYDIEAQRSLAAKFLDDKLTSQRLTAGTNKQILGQAKTSFDTNMASRKVANAQGVNDANNSAWAAAMAAWQANQPVVAPAAGPAPAGPAAPAAAAKPKAAANTLFAPTPTAKKPTVSPNPDNRSPGGTKPKTKTTKVVYGAGTP